jgi:HB1, ASXL, restriction endonuclease HTH domain
LTVAVAVAYTASVQREGKIVNEINHLEAVLQQLLAERAELENLITALQKRLGKPIGESKLAIPAKPVGVGVDPASVVYRGAFFNLAVTKAAEKLLKTYGRPLKTPEILRALQEAEYEKIKGENARSIIYTALLRSRDFVKVLPDTWDLAERHPEAAAKKAEELAAKAAKPKKGKKAKNAAPKAGLKPTVVSEAKVA